MLWKSGVRGGVKHTVLKRKGGQEEGKDKRKGTKEGKRERPLKIGHFGRYAVWVRLVLPPELKSTRGEGVPHGK